MNENGGMQQHTGQRRSRSEARLPPSKRRRCAATGDDVPSPNWVHFPALMDAARHRLSMEFLRTITASWFGCACCDYYGKRTEFFDQRDLVQRHLAGRLPRDQVCREK